MSHVRRWVGKASITDCRYGFNAYGSVMSQEADGSLIPVICMHGGSRWLCLECAKKLMEEQRLIDMKFEEEQRLNDLDDRFRQEGGSNLRDRAAS